MQNETTLSEIKEQIKQEEPSMNELISIEDINQNVDSWDNVDKDKLADSMHMDMSDAWTYGINHPYDDTIRELAVSRFVDDMQRVPMDDLNPDKFGGIEDMAVNGYWPNSVSRDEITEIVYEWKDDISFFHEYEQEIMFEIEASIIEARLDF